MRGICCLNALPWQISGWIFTLAVVFQRHEAAPLGQGPA